MQEVKREQVYITTKYIAADGKEFDTPEKCKAYEMEMERALIDLSDIEFIEAMDFCPCDGGCYDEGSTYHWYKINSEGDRVRIAFKYNLSNSEMECAQVGGIICVEEGYADSYIIPLRYSLDYMEKLFSRLGFEIEIRPKENI